MEKTLGELFDKYTSIYLQIEKNPEDESLRQKFTDIGSVIGERINYLSENLELNIMANMLLRANKEYFWSLSEMEPFIDDWIENAEDLAALAVALYQAIKVKEKYIKNIDKFMEYK